MEVTITYEQDGAIGKVSIHGTDYYGAREEAFALVPDGAQRTSIRVNYDA